MWYYFLQTHDRSSNLGKIYNSTTHFSYHNYRWNSTCNTLQSTVECVARGHPKPKEGQQLIYSCRDYSTTLISCIGLDVSGDKGNVHPPQFCNPRYAIIRRIEKASQEGIPYTHSLDVFEWAVHNEENCLVSCKYSRTKTQHLP